MNDLIIIGGGPAGVAAGVYASRKLLTSVLIAEEIGGQSTVSEGIENWIGTVKIHGSDLKASFKAHLDAYKGDVVQVAEGERVAKLEKAENGFVATTNSGAMYQGRAVLIASGAARRRLTIPGADQFEHKGLTYCASCDGPLFSGQDVAVVGGGNAGLETAAQLLAYCKSVTLIHKHDELKGDAITVQRLTGHPNFKTICKSEPSEVIGEKFVSGLKVKNRDTGLETTLSVSGVFVEIGVIPNTDFAKGLVELDEVGRVVTNPRNQHAYLLQPTSEHSQTSVMASDTRHGTAGDVDVRPGTAEEPAGTRNKVDEVSSGVWAAGDCTDELYHQNNIAAGDAVKALEDIYVHLKAR